MKKISALAPIDRTASFVTRKGYSYTPDKKIETGDSDLPLKIDTSKICSITGLRRGRLTVVGNSNERNSRLVCKCDCGIYTFRKSRVIRNIKNQQERCGNSR